jgi:hypothetical protein
MARSSGTTVFLTAKGPDLKEQLAAASFVKKAEPLGEAQDGFQRLAVQSDGQRDISLDVFKLAVQKGWLVSELRAESASLEDVFAKLTRGQA